VHKHTFGHGRPAYIAQANKQHFHSNTKVNLIAKQSVSGILRIASIILKD
jgi:hypothetical protein